MEPYRRSYWKTILASGGLAGGLIELGAVIARIGFTAARHLSVVAIAARAVVGLALTGVAGVLSLIALGGLISLHRDALEARGEPYAPRQPREWRAGAVLRAWRKLARVVGALFNPSPSHLALRPGEVVEVRPLPEVLATLDENGALDHLPFMPEMAALSGRRFRVFRRIEKVHDYVHMTGLRRLHDTVLLEGLRCDGSSHGGCQASCQVLWKEAWLRRVEPGHDHAPPTAAPARSLPVLTAGDLAAKALRDPAAGSYVCQMTEVASASTPMRWGDPRHYARDLLQGNVRPVDWIVGVSLNLFRWAQRRRGGSGFPNWFSPERKTSPHLSLGLQPGERVRVRRKSEIAQTLNSRNRNRGLWFDAEMIRYCGGEYRVAARVERLIEEKSGTLITVSNPCIILDTVTATGEYLGFAPQNEAIFWREIWLERVVPEYETREGAPGDQGLSVAANVVKP